MSDIIDETLPLDSDLAGYGAKNIRDTRIAVNDIDADYKIIGKSLKLMSEYIPISASHSWLCMSLPDATLSTANYSQAFIDVLRAKKIVYDEFNTALSSFGGAWSGSNFTLANNAANIAMITELAEDWLFAGSPTSGWRILVSNGVEYNITNIVVSTRVITVSGSPAGTSIEIYLNRIINSTTSAKHFSWAGLGLYMTGQNKITGLRRRDMFESHAHWITSSHKSHYILNADTGGGQNYALVSNQYSTIDSVAEPKTDGTNVLRTGSKTEIESTTAMLYLYVGAYTA